MEFLPADYALGALAIAMAVLGLFRGFSGTLAFALACISAGIVFYFGWEYSISFTPVVWLRGAGVLVAGLLAFGLVRLLVKKLVGGLLAGPSDALFGFLIGLVLAVLVAAAWAYSGIRTDLSNVVMLLSGYVR